jgi:hypothetical protein
MIIDGDRLATTFDLDFVGMVEEQFHSVYRKAKTNVLLAEGWRDIPAYAVNETYGEPPAWANLALVGWERSEAASSTPLAVRLYWRQLATVDEDIHTSLRLVARDGTQIARTDGPLDQGLLSLSDLEEGTFPEFKPLVVPEVAPGLYRLDVVAYDSETQDPIGPPIAVDWIQIGANDLPGAHIPDASWNEGLTLVGLDRLPARLTTNEPLALRMAWRTAQPLERDYTVFVHLIGPDGTIVAQRDQAPLNGFYPTSRWIASKPGDEAHASTERAMIVTDMYELELPSPLASGEYRLLVGWYDPATGKARRPKQKIVSRSVAKTKLGMAMPSSAAPMSAWSGQRLRCTAAIAPQGAPIRSASASAQEPNVRETGKDAAMISFTLRSRYLNDGPRSPCASERR